MKRSHEVPPMRVAAHLKTDSAGKPKLEWSRVHNIEETVDLGLPDTRASGLILKFKRWIDRRIGAYEDEIRMLRRLHRTKRLEIVFEDGKAERSQFEQVLDDYWKVRQARHTRRMLIAGIAVLPALILTVLPGPNVVGIPLAYLAWHHWRIVKGLKQVRAGEIEVDVKAAGKGQLSRSKTLNGAANGAIAGDDSHETAELQHP